jgi:GAF domain-containing protein
MAPPRSLADEWTAIVLPSAAATAGAIDAAEKSKGKGDRGGRVPRWALEEDRALAGDDVLVYVARRWQAVIVGPLPIGGVIDRADVFTGAISGPSSWTEVPVVRHDGTTLATVAACLIGEGEGTIDQRAGTNSPPFTLAGEVFEAGRHAELIRLFLPFGSDHDCRATGVLEVGYHRSYERRPDWGQVEALRAAAAQVAAAVETARLYEDARRHAEQLELSADVSQAIASSIDLDQTLSLVAQNLVRPVNASLCQIALYEEDREGWCGAAASDHEDVWRRQHGERSEPSFFFDVLDRVEPVVIEDSSASDRVSASYVRAFGVRSLMALPLVADGQPIGAVVLAERDHLRVFTKEEVQLAQGLALQAAVAIKNARLHALAEEERQLQKDFVLLGFGQWGRRPTSTC